MAASVRYNCRNRRRSSIIPKENSETPVGILIGVVGGGKTTLYNKLCHRNRDAGNHADSQTTKFAKARTNYKELVMGLYDGPGSNAKRDVWKHSMVLVAGLTHEELNTIFVAIPYQVRINVNIVDKLTDDLQILKEEHWGMVIPIITKMDLFQPDDVIKTRKQEQQRIKKYILDEFGDFISDVLFYADGTTSVITMFQNMHRIMKRMPKQKIEYTGSEIAMHFKLREWRGLDIIRLKHMDNKIDTLVRSYANGLQDYRDNNPGDMQEVVYAAIRQNQGDLEDILYEYQRKFCKDLNTHDDYAAYIELQRMVVGAKDRFRAKAMTFIPDRNTEDTSDWRNCVRRCYHCGEIWIKVEGCDDKTTCGNLPTTSEGNFGETITRWVGDWVKNAAGAMVMKFREKQETLKPESSVVWDMILSEVQDVGSMLCHIKYTIAEVLRTERGKVSLKVSCEHRGVCVFHVDVHTRDVENVILTIRQHDVFVQRFMDSISHTGVILEESGIGKPSIVQSKKKIEPKRRDAAGCGKEIIWRNCTPVDPKEIANQLLKVADIKTIVDNISSQEAFKQQYQQKKLQENLKEEDKFEGFSVNKIDSDDETMI